MIQDARPRNTVAVYEPKQKEFRDFCERKQYQDADTVTEDKLLLFLVEEVADRPLRARSRKAAEDTLQEATRLAWRSVRSYTTVFEHPVQTPELSKANLRTHNQLRAIHGDPRSEKMQKKKGLLAEIGAAGEALCSDNHLTTVALPLYQLDARDPKHEPNLS
ncbi:hypothetical protein BGZ61DRAFT_541539 [Ilyonectria robusta]|uniref:uncharacterized protein n=1 Tax=Ilyonectria robusta TaxID=1079257 RepID=UPI001E8E5380|nr:uncharacterized protein BGZ61DRAFT_541539 [Ilyonectria robusta]KAH8654278.1 hypothetical protein BGZ61DRAFT_541539 [Ilyonectria robusta]